MRFCPLLTPLTLSFRAPDCCLGGPLTELSKQAGVRRWSPGPAWPLGPQAELYQMPNLPPRLVMGEMPHCRTRGLLPEWLLIRAGWWNQKGWVLGFLWRALTNGTRSEGAAQINFPFFLPPVGYSEVQPVLTALPGKVSSTRWIIHLPSGLLPLPGLSGRRPAPSPTALQTP